MSQWLSAVIWRRGSGTGFVPTLGFVVLLLVCTVGDGDAVCDLPLRCLLYGGTLGGPLGSRGLHAIGVLNEPSRIDADPLGLTVDVVRDGGRESAFQLGELCACHAEALRGGGDLLPDLDEALVGAFVVAEVSVVVKFALVSASGVIQLSRGPLGGAGGDHGYGCVALMFWVTCLSLP